MLSQRNYHKIHVYMLPASVLYEVLWNVDKNLTFKNCYSLTIGNTVGQIKLQVYKPRSTHYSLAEWLYFSFDYSMNTKNVGMLHSAVKASQCKVILKMPIYCNVNSLINNWFSVISAYNYFHVWFSCDLQILLPLKTNILIALSGKIHHFPWSIQRKKNVTNGFSVFIYLYVFRSLIILNFVLLICTLRSWTTPRLISPFLPFYFVSIFFGIHQMQFVLPISSWIKMQTFTEASVTYHDL